MMEFLSLKMVWYILCPSCSTYTVVGDRPESQEMCPSCCVLRRRVSVSPKGLWYLDSDGKAGATPLQHTSKWKQIWHPITPSTQMKN